MIDSKSPEDRIWRTIIGRVRLIGWIEGTSYLVLLGIAMPLKYLAGMPRTVRIVGAIHGALFVIFCAALAHAWLSKRLTFLRAALVFVASLVPFGTFAIDGWLRRIRQAAERDSE